MNFDSVIFDMDGTLWDAVDSYCKVWNKTIADLGINAAEVTRPRLAALMGVPIEGIYSELIGDEGVAPEFMERLGANERAMMPSLGGRLYPGVRATLEALRERGVRLFMVSNCQADGLPNFLKFSGLGPLVEGTLSFGDDGCEKDVNIRRVVGQYGLKRPVYVGDTSGDCRSSHAAGVPFVWAAYGFGRGVTGEEHKIDSIEELVDIV